MTVLEHRMATPAPRKRRAAAPLSGRSVKTSLILSAELHTKLAAAAAIAGIDKNSLVVECLAEHLRGIVIHDRRKTAGRTDHSHRPSLEDELSPDAEEEAA
jgi:hypothetical protein